MTIHDVGSVPAGPTDPAESADADLVLRSRSGDRTAYGELWRRHYQSGITVARAVSPSFDADDLVQEAFTRIYRSIVHGGGPTGSFRAYLFTSIRNTAATWGRARRETAMDVLDTLEDPSTSEQATSRALDRGLTQQAFRSLPSRWQEVLWYSEIEQMKPAEIAPLLGMKPTAVAQLTFRAREGLREAWIQAHLRSLADGSDCQWTVDHLGAYARLTIGRRDRAKVEAHLGTCARCTIVASEAEEVSGRLALVLLPLAVGAVGATGYLATLHGVGIPAMTLAAMPAAVMQGAVTVTSVSQAGVAAAGAGTSAAGSAAGSAAVAGAGTTAAAAAAGSTSAAAGTAASVAGAAATAGTAAAGTAAVAGGTAAGAGAVLAGAATASTAAAGAAGGLLSSVSVMAGLATAGLVVVTGVIGGAVGLPVIAASNVTDSGRTSVTERLTSDSSATTEDVVKNGGNDKGAVDDANADTKTDAPGKDQQSDQQAPNSSPVGPTQTGRGSTTPPPGQEAKTPSPAPTPTPTPSTLATDSLAIASSSSYTVADTPGTTIVLTVTGVPGASVAVRVRGTVVATGAIGDDGSASLVIHAGERDVTADARIDIRYVDAKSTGAPLTARLSELL